MTRRIIGAVDPQLESIGMNRTKRDKKVASRQTRPAARAPPRAGMRRRRRGTDCKVGRTSGRQVVIVRQPMPKPECSRWEIVFALDD
jgi:hypothetical protein